MSEQESYALADVSKQWEEETPLFTVDHVVGELLKQAQKGEEERAKLMRQMRELSIGLAELRVKVRLLGAADGGESDVHV